MCLFGTEVKSRMSGVRAANHWLLIILWAFLLLFTQVRALDQISLECFPYFYGIMKEIETVSSVIPALQLTYWSFVFVKSLSLSMSIFRTYR